MYCRVQCDDLIAPHHHELKILDGELFRHTRAIFNLPLLFLCKISNLKKFPNISLPCGPTRRKGAKLVLSAKPQCSFVKNTSHEMFLVLFLYTCKVV